MKQKLFLLFALILAVTQGWAMPTDSLRTLTQLGVNSFGVGGIDGVNGLNQVTFSDGTNSSSSSAATPETIIFDKIPVGTSQDKYLYFKTDSNNPNFISYNASSDYNSAKMYSFYGAIVDSVRHKYTYNTNPNYPYLGQWRTVYWTEYTWAIKATYKPTTSGTHNATFTFKKVTYNTLFLRYESSYQNYKCTGSAVRPTVTVNTSSISFGNVILGNSATRTIKVTGTNLTGNLTLSPNNSNFTVSPATITPAQAAVGQAVTVRYTPSEVGNHSGVLKISGGGASCQVNLTGTCVSNQTISANPSTWDFGTVNLGNEVTKTFTITGTNLNSRISVTSQMETTGGEFTVSPTDLPATGGTVTVRYKPLDPGSASAVFVFSSGEATTRITVSGKCVAPSNIAVNPTSLAFGNVVKGNTSSKTFTVTGTNLTGSLTVSSSNSNFKVSPTTITAAQAAAGKVVTVTYQPSAAGSHSATITISGGGASPKTISVTGKCVVPTISVSKTSLTFASNSSQTFKVTGTNLTGSLALIVKGGNGVFSASPTSITASQAANGVTVTVYCNPATNLQHTSATIVISGGGASSKSVSLGYDSSNPEPMAGLILPDGEDEGGNEEFANGGSLDFLGNSTTDVQELLQEAKIFAEGKNIIIESPVEQNAIISDVAGRARRVNLQAGRNEIPVNASGIYIVGIREKTAKLMIK